MRECLKCKKDISDKHEKAKFCSTSCRVMWNRNPANKKPKGLTELQQVKVLCTAIMERIEKMPMAGIAPQIEGQTLPQQAPMPIIQETPKMRLKRSPASWVELRRECQTAEDYDKWLDDLENDRHLTEQEKSQIKQTT